MKKTAVTEIKEHCEKLVKQGYKIDTQGLIDWIECTLLEMEKQQIIEAREDGHDCTYAEYGESPTCHLDGSHESYYIETYGE